MKTKLHFGVNLRVWATVITGPNGWRLLAGCPMEGADSEPPTGEGAALLGGSIGNETGIFKLPFGILLPQVAYGHGFSMDR